METSLVRQPIGRRRRPLSRTHQPPLAPALAAAPDQDFRSVLVTVNEGSRPRSLERSTVMQDRMFRRKRQAGSNIQNSRSTRPKHGGPGFRSRKLSKLEALPTELIQRIFFHWPHPNLPRASLRLGQALASAYVIKRSMNMFRSFEGASGVYRVAEDGSHLHPEDPDLKDMCNEYIKCKWMDSAILFELRDRVLTEERVRLRGCLAAGTEDDAARKNFVSNIKFHLGVQIPRRLLQFPITEETRVYIEALVDAGCTIDTVNSLAPEDASASLCQHIARNDYAVVHTLMSPGIAATITATELHNELSVMRHKGLMIQLIRFTLEKRLEGLQSPVQRQAVDQLLADNKAKSAIYERQGLDIHMSGERSSLIGNNTVPGFPSKMSWHGGPCHGNTAREPTRTTDGNSLPRWKCLTCITLARYMANAEETFKPAPCHKWVWTTNTMDGAD